MLVCVCLSQGLIQPLCFSQPSSPLVPVQPGRPPLLPPPTPPLASPKAHRPLPHLPPTLRPLPPPPTPSASPSPPLPSPLHSHPGAWVEREQPALSKHKDRSCQQVAMATASLSPSRHFPDSVKGSVENRRGPFSSSRRSHTAQIRWVTVFFWHPLK